MFGVYIILLVETRGEDILRMSHIVTDTFNIVSVISTQLPYPSINKVCTIAENAVMKKTLK